MRAANAVRGRDTRSTSRIPRPVRQVFSRVIKRLITSGDAYVIDLDGEPFYLPRTQDSWAEYGSRSHEQYTADLWRKCVKPGATVVDIGAQVGYFAVMAGSRVRPGGQVFAFEPVPRNLDVLRRNISARSLDGVVQPVDKAVSNEPGTIEMVIYRDSDSHGMHAVPGAVIEARVSVECVTLDSFLNGAKVDVIKLDIEGHDERALRGMSRTISGSTPLVLFAELAPAYLRRAGTDPREYVELIRNFGFTIHLIDERARQLRPFTLDELARLEQNSSAYMNMYCVKPPR